MEALREAISDAYMSCDPLTHIAVVEVLVSHPAWLVNRQSYIVWDELSVGVLASDSDTCRRGISMLRRIVSTCDSVDAIFLLNECALALLDGSDLSIHLNEMLSGSPEAASHSVDQFVEEAKTTTERRSSILLMFKAVITECPSSIKTNVLRAIGELQ
jgi:hypothetical protein